MDKLLLYILINNEESLYLNDKHIPEFEDINDFYRITSTEKKKSFLNIGSDSKDSTEINVS